MKTIAVKVTCQEKFDFTGIILKMASNFDKIINLHDFLMGCLKPFGSSATERLACQRNMKTIAVKFTYQGKFDFNGIVLNYLVTVLKMVNGKYSM